MPGVERHPLSAITLITTDISFFCIDRRSVNTFNANSPNYLDNPRPLPREEVVTANTPCLLAVAATGMDTYSKLQSIS